MIPMILDKSIGLFLAILRFAKENHECVHLSRGCEIMEIAEK